ncbi:hypothetical protein RUND412_010024, partial [Rhizina undulata]
LPKPSSEFPTAVRILELLGLLCSTNADSNVTAEVIIVIPTSTWDRNNSHWEYRLQQVRDAVAQAFVKNRSEKATLEIEFTQKMRAMNPEVAGNMREKARREYMDSLQERKVYEELKKKVEDKEAAKVELEVFILKSKPAPKPPRLPLRPHPHPLPLPTRRITRDLLHMRRFIKGHPRVILTLLLIPDLNPTLRQSVILASIPFVSILPGTSVIATAENVKLAQSHWRNSI